MADLCLECLKEQAKKISYVEPNINKTNTRFSNTEAKCDGCGAIKHLVVECTEPHAIGLYIDYGSKIYDFKIPLKTLIDRWGWNEVLNRLILIENEEEPIGFRTHEEYEPYFNDIIFELYRNKIILRKPEKVLPIL